MEQQFSLSWNNFHGNLTKGFSNLLANCEFVDVTLAVDGHLLQAHKIVLSICSPYFKKMFKQNPCQHPIVVLRGVTIKAMRDLLQFMYHGEVSVRQEDLTSFISTAEILQIKGLTNKTSDDDLPEVEKPSPSSPLHNDASHNQHVSPHSPCKALTEDPPLTPEPNNTDHEHQQNNNLTRLNAMKRKADDYLTNALNIYHRTPSESMLTGGNEKRLKFREKINALKFNSHMSMFDFDLKQSRFDNDDSSGVLNYNEPASASIAIPPAEHNNLNPQSRLEMAGNVKAENEEPTYNLIQRRYSDSVLSNSQDAVTMNGAPDGQHAQSNTDSKGSTDDCIADSEWENEENLLRRYYGSRVGEDAPKISLHTIVTIPQKEDGKKKYPQRSCRTCWRSGKRRDTRFMCAECTIPLCKTSCFEEHLCDVLNDKNPVQ